MFVVEPLLTSRVLGVVVLAVDEDRFATMGRFFVIALLVLSPWWLPGSIRTIRSRAAERSRAQALALGSATVVPPVGSLAEVMAELERCVDEGDDEFELFLRVDLTISGGPAPAMVVDSVLADALRRSKVEITAESIDGSGRTLHCRRTDRDSEKKIMRSTD